MQLIRRTGDFAAPPERVFAVIADPAFHTDKVRRTSEGDGGSATVDPDGDGVRIETVRLLATAGFPDFVRAVVGSRLTVREISLWGAADATGARVGTLSVSVVGAPVTLRGSLALTPTATGTTEIVDAQLRAAVPLLGGKVEQAATPALLASIDTELDLLRARLRA